MLIAWATYFFTLKTTFTKRKIKKEKTNPEN